MQNRKKYEIKKLDWDTNFFGVKAAKVLLNETIYQQDVEDILKNLKENQYKFITIQNINNNDANNIVLMHMNKIFLTDVNIQFIKELKENDSNKNISKEIFVENKMKYNESIISISKEAFKYSRFVNDKNLKNGNKIYSEWTKNSFENEDKYFCYYKEDETILGYLLFSVEKDYLIIELIAVDKRHNGKGIGKQLIDRIEIFAREKGITRIHVGTQLNNIYAQNFYNKCGFKHVTNHSIYHLWL